MSSAALEKNQPICVSGDAVPNAAASAMSVPAHRATKIATIRPKRIQCHCACGGVGVSSSMTAGACVPPAARRLPPGANARGSNRPPAMPSSAAPSTISGKGTASAKMATNAAAAIAHSAGCFSAREPIRHAACSTIATTAGLTP